MPGALIDLYRSKGIKALFEIPSEFKVFKAYQILGDREVPVYFVMYPNNFLIGTTEGWSRLFVGKIGEKDYRGKAELSLFYIDHSHLLPHLGEDFSKVEFFRLTKYRGTMDFKEGCIPVFLGSFGRSIGDMGLPESDGVLYSEIKECTDDYITGSISAYLYALIQETLSQDPSFYLALKTIEKNCDESNRAYTPSELEKAYDELNAELMSRPYALSFRRK